MQNENIHSGSHLKKIITKGSWYFIASIIIKALAILTWPITTRYLIPYDTGILDVLESIRQFLPILISLGLDEAYVRFYFSHNKTSDEIQCYVSTYFWIIIGWGFFIFIGSTIVGFFSLTKIFKIPFLPFIPFTMVGPLLIQLSILGGVYLKQQLKSAFYSIFQVLMWVVFYIFFLGLLIFPKLGSSAKIYGFLAADIFSLIVFGYVLLKNKLIKFKFNLTILFEGLKYSLPLLPSQMMYWITGLSDRILIGLIKSFGSTGIYSIGYKLGQSLTVFSEALLRVYQPIMFSMLTENRQSAVKRIENFIPSYFFVMFWLAMCINIFAKEIIILLTDKQYHAAYLIAPIVVMAYLFGIIYKPFYHLLSFHKKTWLISLGAIIQATMNFCLNLILIPIFDRIAAAYTTLISYMFFFIWIFLWSQKYEKLEIKWKKIILVILISLIAFLINFIINRYLLLNLFVSILVKTVLIGASIIFSLFTKIIDLRYFNLKDSSNGK
jgi:O-antigen/teichoic acid export membrane protein